VTKSEWQVHRRQCMSWT